VCTQQHIRSYFIDGTLPAPGTVCHPVSYPFPVTAGLVDKQDFSTSMMTVEEQEIYDAVSQLSRDSGITTPLHLKI
jgi:hypothetical protein